jgi:hypothetical protein
MKSKGCPGCGKRTGPEDVMPCRGRLRVYRCTDCGEDYGRAEPRPEMPYSAVEEERAIIREELDYWRKEARAEGRS